MKSTKKKSWKAPVIEDLDSRYNKASKPNTGLENKALGTEYGS